MFRMLLVAAAVLVTTAVRAIAGTIVLTVGATGQYPSIGAAVAAANRDANPANEYVISVAPGTYTNDTPTITRPMTIQAAAPGSAVILNQTVPLANQKGIFLVTASLIVDGLTFQNAAIDNALGGNGAGIRDEDTANNDTLTVRNSTFINNQMGILTDIGIPLNVVLVNDLFINNGNPNPSYFGHSVYISTNNSLVAIGNEICGTNIGHDIKSRAAVNVIQNNTLYDGAADPNQPGCAVGSTSFALDLPNGGVGLVVGNTMIQGPSSQNEIMFAYGEEGLKYPTNSILFINNTMDNTYPGAIGIYDNPSSPIPVIGNGNTFAPSIATPVDPPSANQLVGSTPGISPDGSILAAPSTGSLTTAVGTWTFGTSQPQPGQYVILLNGGYVNGWGAKMEVAHGGNLYVYNSVYGNWWLWSGGGWTPTGAP